MQHLLRPRRSLSSVAAPWSVSLLVLLLLLLVASSVNAQSFKILSPPQPQDVLSTSAKDCGAIQVDTLKAATPTAIDPYSAFLFRWRAEAPQVAGSYYVEYKAHVSDTSFVSVGHAIPSNPGNAASEYSLNVTLNPAEILAAHAVVQVSFFPSAAGAVTYSCAVFSMQAPTVVLHTGEKRQMALPRQGWLNVQYPASASDTQPPPTVLLRARGLADQQLVQVYLSKSSFNDNLAKDPFNVLGTGRTVVGTRSPCLSNSLGDRHLLVRDQSEVSMPYPRMVEVEAIEVPSLLPTNGTWVDAVAMPNPTADSGSLTFFRMVPNTGFSALTIDLDVTNSRQESKGLYAVFVRFDDCAFDKWSDMNRSNKNASQFSELTHVLANEGAYATNITFNNFYSWPNKTWWLGVQARQSDTTGVVRFRIRATVQTTSPVMTIIIVFVCVVVLSCIICSRPSVRAAIFRKLDSTMDRTGLLDDQDDYYREDQVVVTASGQSAYRPFVDEEARGGKSANNPF